MLNDSEKTSQKVLTIISKIKKRKYELSQLMQDITSNEASPFFFINHSDNFLPDRLHSGQQNIEINVVNIPMSIIQLPKIFLSSFLGRGFNILIIYDIYIVLKFFGTYFRGRRFRKVLQEFIFTDDLF